MAWQKASGYNWRALVEYDIARWKRVIGDGLRSQTDGRQARGGHRGRRAEPNAGAGTPGVRPHRMTQNTGRAQCAHTPDPRNKVIPDGQISIHSCVETGSSERSSLTNRSRKNFATGPSARPLLTDPQATTWSPKPGSEPGSSENQYRTRAGLCSCPRTSR